MSDNIHNGAVQITWEQLKQEVGKDKISSMLCNQIKDGFPEYDDKKKMRPEVQTYWKHREHLSQVDGVPLYKDRVVVPAALRPAVLEILHGAHQGEKGMQLRASSSVWWPGITPQIKEKRSSCRICNQIAPSQPMAPPEPLQMPDFPFQQVASDYFQLGGRTYLVIVDRYSGWPVVAYCGNSTGNSGMLTNKLREYFSTFGIPEEIATDGGLPYTSYETQQFFKDYGVRHRLSSVAFAQSNKRAELAVKSMKRLLRENTSYDGSLNTDRYLRALMAYRNTPDQDTKMSPAQVIFGRQLRDFLPAPHERYKPDPGWVKMKNEREKLMAKRALANTERRAVGCKTLPKLAVGEHVMMQNQDGNNPRRWDHTGRVVEVRGNDQYVIKTDGSNRLSLHNRNVSFSVESLPMNMS